MFEFLKVIDLRLYERYLTVERNIKAGSNSFYDAYLDLLEQFIKTVAVEFEVEIFSRDTCGAILKRAEMSTVLKETLCIDDYTFAKMQDYTLKVNSHKHKGEKKIQVETVVSYMRVIYNAFSAYCAFKDIAIDPFDGNYFIDNFGLWERENIQLKTQVSELKDELKISVEQHKLKEKDIEEYRKLMTEKELEKLSLEEQNAELYKMVNKLKDIKLSSMEEKLNKTIELLHELTAQVVENRAISYAVGDTICGRKLFESYVERAKGDLKHER